MLTELTDIIVFVLHGHKYPSILFRLSGLEGCWRLSQLTYTLDGSLACGRANRETFTLTFTSMGNLESPINLTPISACLWTLGGRNPHKYIKNVQILHRKTLAKHPWSPSQDRLAVRQQYYLPYYPSISQISLK